LTQPENPRKPAGEILKYSGMAFQMAVYLVAGWWLGSFADRYLNTAKPYFSLAFAVLFLSAYFVKLIRDLSKK